VEFEAYRAFAGSAVPVPEMLWLEEASNALDHPFFIAAELAGFQAAPQMLFSGGYDAVLPKGGGAQVDDPRRDRPGPTRWRSASTR
jgi:aminoglycoside phosphotransferase (APT) family kinase protein